MNPWILIGLIGGGAALAGAAMSGAIRAQVEKARDELLEVGPNCSFINVRGVGEGASEAKVNKAIKKARRYYFEPKIAEARKLFPPAAMGAKVYSRAAMGFILKDLIPECDWGDVPTKPSDPRFFVYLTLGNWIRIEALTGLECDPLEEAPAGTICVTKGKGHVLARKSV